MTTKLQDELKDITAKLADAQARHTDLYKRHQASMKAVREGEAQLDAALLGGKSATKIQTELAAERERERGLKRAHDNLSTAEIARLEGEKSRLEYAVECERYEGELTAASEEAKAIFALLEQAAGRIGAIHLTPPPGYTPSDPVLRVTKDAVDHLRQFGLYPQVREWKRILPEMYGLPPNKPPAPPPAEPPKPQSQRNFVKDPVTGKLMADVEIIGQPRKKTLAEMHGLPASADADNVEK